MSNVEQIILAIQALPQEELEVVYNAILLKRRRKAQIKSAIAKARTDTKVWNGDAQEEVNNLRDDDRL